jgi:outer membrane protein insertion porin family
MCWRRVVVALWCLAACVPAARAAEDGIGLPLRRVHLECDAWFDEASVRALLPLTNGVPVTQDDLDRSRVVLEHAQIFRAISVDTLAEDGEAVVWFHLKRRQVLTTLRVSGYDAVGWRDVYRSLRLRTGSFFDRDALRAARRRLVERYKQLGYPHATVKTHVYKRPGEVDLDVTIDEGPPLAVAATEIVGDLGIPKPALDAEVYLLIGKPYQRDTLRTGERALLGALRDGGYYDAQVEGEFVPAGEQGGVLSFKVHAGPHFELVIEGNSHLSRHVLLHQMDLSTRLIVTDGTWRELARRMTQAYQENGFYRATVAAKVQDGNPRRVDFVVHEGKTYAVDQVRFLGEHGLTADELRAHMNTQAAHLLPVPDRGAFVPSVFDEDLRRLWYYYRAQGFSEAEIVDAPIAVDEADGTIEVTVVVEEGPRTMVVAVTPPDLPEEANETPTYVVVPNAPLRPADLDLDQQAIAAVWRRQGYNDVVVAPVVDRERVGEVDEATVAWKITPGVQRHIGDIIVQGNVETRDDIVREQLPFRSGDPLNLEALQRGQDAIYQLGTYRSVAVQPLSDTDLRPDVGVDVVPRPPGTFQWGLGYNTRDGFTANGETSYDNISRRARRVYLRAQLSILPEDPSSSQYLAVLGYREPRFLSSDWQWKVELLGERSTRAIDQYSVQRTSIGTGFSRAFFKRLQTGAEAQVEYADVFDVQPLAFRGQDQGPSWTTAVSPFVLYDGRDDPFAPTRGVFDTARFRYALPGVSTVSFGKLNLQHSQALPLASWLAFIYTARLGYGHSFEGEEVLPIRERFFIGGATTVRGYSENSLGPTSPHTDQDGELKGNVVLGGDLALILNLEARVPIYGALSAAAFLDTGGLFLVQCDAQCEAQNHVRNNGFTWDNFRKGAGPGLRYMTPVGPISLDYGFKIDRRPGESIGEVHFSISGTF